MNIGFSIHMPRAEGSIFYERVYLSPEEIKQQAKNSKNEGTEAKPRFPFLLTMVKEANEKGMEYIMLGILEADSPEKITAVINFMIEDLENGEIKQKLQKLKKTLEIIPEDRNPFLADNQKNFRIPPNLQGLLEWQPGLRLSEVFVEKLRNLIDRLNNAKHECYLDFVYGTDRERPASIHGPQNAPLYP